MQRELFLWWKVPSPLSYLPLWATIQLEVWSMRPKLWVLRAFCKVQALPARCSAQEVPAARWYLRGCAHPSKQGVFLCCLVFGRLGLFSCYTSTWNCVICSSSKSRHPSDVGSRFVIRDKAMTLRYVGLTSSFWHRWGAACAVLCATYTMYGLFLLSRKAEVQVGRTACSFCAITVQRAATAIAVHV